MAKSKGTDPKKETEARIKRTEAYAEKVRLLFAQTVNDILALNKTMPELDDGVMFSFDGESMKKQKEVEALLRRLHSAVTLAIREGVDVEWSKANAEADRLIKSVFGRKVLDSPEFTAWTQRNTEARDAFLARSEKGLNLSDRVWKSVNQLRDEMEVAITVSIGEGKSASAMSREVRQYLNDPDLMFRRFRYKKGEDDDGNPIYGRKWKKRVKDEATGQYRWIDYDRDSYPTGQGVYKSSAKNAMRLTRTETNIAYRRADHERWMQMDFVIGQRIQTAHDHKEKDICDKLKGDYPKDFVFDGWHPQCFCFATPILLDDKYTDSMEDMFLRGEDWEGEIRKRAEEHSIRELPDSFKRWVSENGEKIAASRKRGTEPYFLRENRAAVDGILGKIDTSDIHAKLAIATKPKEHRTFASFEPFSPMIMQLVDEAKERKAKNAIFESVMTDERANLMNESKGHRTMMFPGNKGPKTATWAQTMKMAFELNDAGIDVTFLPELEDSISTDSLIKVSNAFFLADFKYCITKKANTLSKELQHGFEQAGTIVLKLTEMDTGLFCDAIDYMVRNNIPYGNIVLMNKYGKTLTLTYKDIKSGKYIRKTKGFL